MELCYHYCSAESFRLIIESSLFHLSSTHNMNDKGEGQFALKILMSEIDNLKEIMSKQDDVYIEAFEAMKNRIISESNDRYILCLSKHNDMLSQWRGYADDGKGLCIGLDMEAFGFEPTNKTEIPQINSSIFNKQSFNLNTVDYCDEELAISKCKTLMKLFKSEMDNISDNQSQRFAGFYRLLSNILFMIKHVSFKEETEIRLMYNQNIHPTDNENSFQLSEDPNYIKQVKFKTRDSFLIPFVELNFKEIKKELIKEITLGPKNNFHESDIKLFLRANNLEHVKVSRSESTYR